MKQACSFFLLPAAFGALAVAASGAADPAATEVAATEVVASDVAQTAVADGRLAANKETVERYVEAFNRGDLAALEGLFTPDAQVQGVLGWGGLDVVMPIWKEIHQAFRIELEVDDMVASGDVVAVRYTERGTFVAPFRGHEPTGKSFQLVAMEWFELRDGKIHRRWGARDSASQARQIGLPLQ